MIVSCYSCGNDFSKKPSLVARSKRHYCSVDCRKIGEERACKKCGKAFYAANARIESGFGEFCSTACARSHSKKTRVCELCGLEFHRLGGGKYCSKKCSGQARIKHERTPCVTCGKDTSGGRKFCSVACHNESQSRNKTSHVCKICGEEFRRSPVFSRTGNPTYCSIACRNLCPEWKRKAVIAGNLIQQHSKDLSRLEKAGAEILVSLAVPFSEQVLIAGKFTVDAVITGKRIVIQWDGDYWHGYRADNDNSPLGEREAKRVALDKSQDAYMEKCGYVVLRFWEHEVFNQPEKVRENIARAIQQAAA